jgi:N2,N2-dimethylguanosine tRNA methyltransferase
MFVLVACVYHLRKSFLANFGHLNEKTRRFLIVCNSLKLKVAMDDSKTICEGQARMTFGENSKVFYNPVQEFNRDIRYVFTY